MQNDSDFLRGLIGKPVRLVAVDERCLPPLPSLVLKEVSSLGVVVADQKTSRFFPWHEIVEIHPLESGSPASSPGATTEAAPAVGSEP